MTRRSALAIKGDRAHLLAPSVLSADPLAVADSIESLRGEADLLHLDIMDGHYVPNLTFGPAFVKAMRKRYPDSILDAHLMVEKSDDLIDLFVDLGADIITVHAEATRHLHRVIDRIASSGAIPGVALNPATPVSVIAPILGDVGLVLVMSVDPGFAAQKFIPSTVGKIVELARAREVDHLDMLIEIDGGISASNAGDVARAGCDILVAGNAVFGASDPSEAAAKIKTIIRAA